MKKAGGSQSSLTPVLWPAGKVRIKKMIRKKNRNRQSKRMIGYLWGIFLFGLLTGCAKENGTKESVTESRDIFAMDTYMSLTATGERASEALDAAAEEIERLDDLFSVGNPESEISIVNENGSEVLSEDTAYLVEETLAIFEDTNGAFDITIYPLMEEWGFTSGEYQVPGEERIKELLECVDASRIEYDKKERFLSLPEGVRIDFGGIAKGYASSRVMEIFEEYGIESGLVSLGGNVQLYHSKPDGSLWKVAIENPKDTGAYIGVLQAKDVAVITSGGYERYFEADGKNYHHIIDPKTGYPAESGLTSVTIVSENGTLADGLSTALFVMGKSRALEYWKEHAGEFDVILMEEDGNMTITEGIEDAFTSEMEFSVERAK